MITPTWRVTPSWQIFSQAFWAVLPYGEWACLSYWQQFRTFWLLQPTSKSPGNQHFWTIPSLKGRFWRFSLQWISNSKFAWAKTSSPQCLPGQGLHSLLRTTSGCVCTSRGRMPKNRWFFSFLKKLITSLLFKILITSILWFKRLLMALKRLLLALKLHLKYT